MMLLDIEVCFVGCY